MRGNQGRGESEVKIRTLESEGCGTRLTDEKARCYYLPVRKAKTVFRGAISPGAVFAGKESERRNWRMDEWAYAQAKHSEKLARIHHFSVCKQQDGKEIEFVITVKEYSKPPNGKLRFFALADKQTNQESAPYTPSGWGETLLTALADCITEVNRFPYQGEI
jgi:hypothetical protein